MSATRTKIRFVLCVSKLFPESGLRVGLSTDMDGMITIIITENWKPLQVFDQFKFKNNEQVLDWITGGR